MRFLLSVSIFVIFQVVLSSESLSTHITRKWPLIRVSSLMNREVVGLCELSVTKLANKSFLLLDIPAALGELVVVVGPHEAEEG